MAEPAREGRDPAGRSGDSRRLPQQLPSGRHGLLPSFVAANQRARILSAVAQAAAGLGYAEMNVEAVIARAGVSRRTFYEHFKNKEDAFLAAYDTVVRQQARQIRRAYLHETGPRERRLAGPPPDPGPPPRRPPPGRLPPARTTGNHRVARGTPSPAAHSTRVKQPGRPGPPPANRHQTTTCPHDHR